MITFKQFLSESINDKGKFKSIFIIGLPGAGKSYTAKRLNGTISPVIVNTDKAAEFIARKKDVIISAKSWKNLIEDDALRITSTMLRNYLNGMLPLFVDGTSNDVSRIMHRVGILESVGYDVGFVHVKTNLALAIARTQSRSKEINREVDEDFIKKVAAENEANVSYLKSKSSFFIEVENSGSFNDAALMKTFKATQGFFNKPVDNPIAQRSIKSLLSAKDSYLVPSVLTKEHLAKLVDGWYK